MEQTLESERQAGEITQLLRRYRQGDVEALAELTPFIYDELKNIARRYVNSPHASWQPTALTHELFVHLLRGEPYDWQNSEHFFATASLKMRHLLVDYARNKYALKHGGGMQQVALDEALSAATTMARLEEILTINELLENLTQEFPRVVRIVELRFFLGFSEEETAAVLQLSTRQVRRDWGFAKAWLKRRLVP